MAFENYLAATIGGGRHGYQCLDKYIIIDVNNTVESIWPAFPTILTDLYKQLPQKVERNRNQRQHPSPSLKGSYATWLAHLIKNRIASRMSGLQSSHVWRISAQRGKLCNFLSNAPFLPKIATLNKMLVHAQGQMVFPVSHGAILSYSLCRRMYSILLNKSWQNIQHR